MGGLFYKHVAIDRLVSFLVSNYLLKPVKAILHTVF